MSSCSFSGAPTRAFSPASPALSTTSAPALPPGLGLAWPATRPATAHATRRLDRYHVTSVLDQTAATATLPPREAAARGAVRAATPAPLSSLPASPPLAGAWESGARDTPAVPTLPATKDKLPAHFCLPHLPAVADRRLGVALPRVASLLQTPDSEYLAGPALAYGSSAKLVPLLRLGDNRRMVAKSLRNAPVQLRPDKHPTQSRFGSERTIYVANRALFAANVQREVIASQLFGGRGAIEQIFATDKATYLPMPAFDCDLATAAKLCNRSERQLLCRTVAVPLAQKLLTMHAAHTVHFDLKPHNILIQLRDLQVELADFGACMPMEPDGVRARYLEVSTFPPPELQPSAEHVRRVYTQPRYGSAKTDTWAFGVSLLMLLVGTKERQWGYSPFFHCSTWLPEFAQWRQSRFVDGTYSRASLADDDDHLLSAYVHQAMLVDAHLTALVVECCLTATEAERLTMAQLLPRLERLRGPAVNFFDQRRLGCVLLARHEATLAPQMFAGLERLAAAAVELAAAEDQSAPRSGWDSDSDDDAAVGRSPVDEAAQATAHAGLTPAMANLG